MSEVKIDDVTDTALWVAVYRALETQRTDALFQDPLAQVLAGDRGQAIAKKMSGTKWTRWGVIIRTCIIDDYIKEAVNDGVDTIVNIGAGLDTRPYRMIVPKKLRWVEIDFPKIINFKEQKLNHLQPQCHLERYKVDLTQDEARIKILSQINASSKKALIITEGVMPYLSNDDARKLAQDLRKQEHFKYWVLDYNAPHIYKYISAGKRKKQMKNAPLLFRPENWFKFFEELDWKLGKTRYLAEESIRLKRAIPFPWWVKILKIILPEKNPERTQKFSGYFVLEPSLPDASLPENDRAIQG